MTWHVRWAQIVVVRQDSHQQAVKISRQYLTTHPRVDGVGVVRFDLGAKITVDGFTGRYVGIENLAVVVDDSVAVADDVSVTVDHLIVSPVAEQPIQVQSIATVQLERQDVSRDIVDQFIGDLRATHAGSVL